MRTSELAREQDYVAMLYRRLDELRDRARADLAAVRRQQSTGTHQSRSERDAFANLHAERLAQLEAVEGGLCFGRLDLEDGSRRYLGRLGLGDEGQERLLVDWRAPAAQPFYRATPARPEGVVRRRHLYSRGRTVTGIDDEVFDLAELSAADRDTLSGEAALLAALTESRTGHMRDIVATIQGEQDRIIRSELDGVLVVQGGPGTGKTAVALHRAAYLLYEHRRRLASSGVLVVGPNPVFLRYIDQVLPSLGETGVLLTTVGEMFPGVVATGAEEEAVAAVKGDPRMARVVREAVAARQRLPRGVVVIPFEQYELRLDREDVAEARARARRTRRPHNGGRLVFARALLDRLLRQLIAAGGTTEETDLPATVLELARVEEFHDLMNRLWPKLTPQQLLEDLYADPHGPRHADLLTAAELRLLRREPGAAWTPADVPLLDEAAEALGDPDAALKRLADRRRREADREHARDVITMTGTGGVLTADLLARRWRHEPSLGAAERAADDRTWAFGHVIVDEAQELSPMAWRMLMRRCPSRSMTVVGDVAQTGSSWGATDWAGVLEPHVPGRWRLRELSVNYRTPTEIMAVAADVLAAVDPALRPPTSVRDAGEQPWVRRLAPSGLVSELPGIVAAELTAVADGTVAVLVPRDLLEPARATVPAHERVSVLPVVDAKGLEFDAVVVVEPGRILAASPRGAGDLYVALTRATRRLGVVHAQPLPEMLRRLAV